ncbi:septum formation initiator family protein [Candidatus Saccharibacteria bacterium]|nr:septum formation initiator family protein [Candidatus Saccharibacteria bacterium]
MQPQNNVQNGVPVAPQPVKTAPVAPQPATAAPVKGEQKKDNLFENAPKKKGKGMLFGLIFCILLAAGGIAFGVWTMMDSKSQKDNLNEQISTLKAQNNTLQSTIDELQAEIKEYQNNATKNEGRIDIGDVELPGAGEVQTEIIEGVFYVKNQMGDVVAKDDSAEFVEIVTCDFGTADASAPLVCDVITATGEGKFIYNYEDGTLTYNAISE